MLKESVLAGATELKLEDWVVSTPMGLEPMQSRHYYDGSAEGLTEFTIFISGNGVSERLAVERKKIGNDWVLQTKAPLRYAYEKGTKIVIEKTQLWGVYLGGSETELNVIANNNCVGNAVGGINWMGKEMQVSGNLGTIVQMDIDQPHSLEEATYPFVEAIEISGLNQSDQGRDWRSDTVLESSDGTSGLAVVLENKTNEDMAEAVYNPAGDPAVLALKPNTDYRVIAWVKTTAVKNGALLLPQIFIQALGADGKLTPISLEGMNLPMQDMRDGEQRSLTDDVWLRVVGMGQTPEKTSAGQIVCRIERGAIGKTWIAGMILEEIQTNEL